MPLRHSLCFICANKRKEAGRIEYTISRLARLAGVTPRTLRHYDDIGLLRPARISSSGYRVYGQEQVRRLQQILFYRELDVDLAMIKELLDDPHFDEESAMRGHLNTLRERRARLDALIDTAEKTLKTIKGEDHMTDIQKFDGFKKIIAENESQYGAEARARYGDEQVDASTAKLMNMTQAQYASFLAVQDDLHEALRLAAAAPSSDSPHARRAAALHKQWLSFTWASYSPEAHRGLVNMYLDDPRFTAYYEEIAPNAARILRDAVCRMLDGEA